MKEKLIKDENYINIQGWMSTKLKLSGNELIIFALIYGFSQVENHSYHGSLQYICDWTNISKQSCISNLKKLVDKKFILKNEKEINGIKFCEYSINLNSIQETLTPIKETLTNNIDNNINLLDNKLSNKNENLESNNENIIQKELDKKAKDKKKLEKIKNALLINQLLETFTDNSEIKSALRKYLDVRKKKGLTAEQWKIILDDLRKECKTDKNYALEKINKAIAGGWMQIIYSSSNKIKPNFDNTSNHNVPKGIASMNEIEKQNFIENDLAKDENGNFLKF